MKDDPAEGLNAAVSAILRGAAKTAGLTYDQLAATTGISKATITRLLKPEPTRHTDVAVLHELCRAMNEDPAEIMLRSRELLERQEARRAAASELTGTEGLALAADEQELSIDDEVESQNHT